MHAQPIVNVDPYADIEVAGGLLLSYVNSFRSFTLVASKFLIAEGFTERDEKGIVKFEKERWYPMPKSLRAIHRAGKEAGDAVVRQIGAVIAENAEAPPGMNDVPSMVAMVNAGYHLNHRKRGQRMFDPQSGLFLNGIGGFRVTTISAKEYEVECHNPYPCAFDHGVFEGGVRRFGGAVHVTHRNDRPCRKNGAGSCTLTLRLVHVPNARS